MHVILRNEMNIADTQGMYEFPCQLIEIAR